MSGAAAASYCTGILLAAGRGHRFDSTGLQNKLLQVLPNGEEVVISAIGRMSQVLTNTLVVVHPQASHLIQRLSQRGFAITGCPDAAAGIGHSLAHAIASTSTAAGWIIALGDMPLVQPQTIAALDAAIARGADIAVPVYRQRRGNPVGFSHRHRSALMALKGDQGARELLRSHPVTEVDVDDDGIFFDVDTPSDLHAVR